jgi:hypothetical protein
MNDCRLLPRPRGKKDVVSCPLHHSHRHFSTQYSEKMTFSQAEKRTGHWNPSSTS